MRFPRLPSLSSVRTSSSRVKLPSSRKGRSLLALTLVGLLVASALGLAGTKGEKTATAYFARTTGIYENDEVRVLGVPVGEIDRIEPDGARMRVTFRYDEDVKVPATANAVIVSPNLVSARFIQLTPAYTGGPDLPDAATIPQERTSVPAEWGQTKKQLSRLVEALGPDGANKTGALSRFLNATAQAGHGQGQRFHDAVDQLTQATRIISEGREDMFGTVRNLQVFVSALAASDEQLVAFNERLDAVSGMLAANRKELSLALSTLAETVGTVEKFVRTHRRAVRTNVDGLAEVTGVLAQQREALENILHVAPNALANFYNIYSPARGSLTGALAAVNLQTPAEFLCSGIAASTPTPEKGAALCAKYLGPLLNQLRMNYPPIGLNPVVRRGEDPNQDPHIGNGLLPGGDGPTAPGGQLPDLEGLLTPGGGE
ncbi:MAG: MCE family protein [Rhodospirillales bacterium]|nr:MCE family protein [Rhodospirillales bacterium]